MKKRIELLMILSLGILLGACKKNETLPSDVKEGPVPTADFSNNSGSLTVKFTANAENATSYYWQFGDGTSATDQSPEHTYAASGTYKVSLKVNSDAGYTDTLSKSVVVSAPATADFELAETGFGLHAAFTNNSTAVQAVSWDFGDGSEGSAELSPVHTFPAFGDYTVTLTVTGLLGDEVSKTKTITVADHNLLKGGGFDAATDSQFWTNWSSQNNNPPEYGYTGDKPAKGFDGCLRFKSFSNSSNSTNQLIYQAVQVEAGKKYRLSAQVKVPAGGSQCYLQFYISKDANTWIEDDSNPNTNHFLALNSWHGWGELNNSVALDGEISTLVAGNGAYGRGAATGGMYTASETGTVYIGIQAGTWAGKSNGDFLVDNLSFTEVN